MTSVGAPAAADVVVVGGGAVGLASALELARRGLRVTVADPAPGSGATHAAAGMLAPVGEARFGEEDLARAALDAAAAWPQFVVDLEREAERTVGFRAVGTLVVAFDPGDRAVLQELHRFHLELGLESLWYGASACRDLEPALAPGVHGGVLAPGDHQVDPRLLVEALLAACEARGVVVVRERVEALETAGGRVRGIRLAGGGSIEAPAAVLAAGAWAGTVAGVPEEVGALVRPVKGQVLRLRDRGRPPLLGRTVRGVVEGSPVYLVPREDGGVVLGATQEERGYDTAVTAEGAYVLLRDALRLVPGASELELVEAHAGLRPASPDNLPLVGPYGPDGLVLAAGHGRNGILFTALTAALVAAYLTDAPAPDEVSRFARLLAPERLLGGGREGPVAATGRGVRP
jgi:glycine oxidase